MGAILDPMNRKILGVLLRDGRATAKEIAEELQRKEGTVRDRIWNLERAGVIKGYSAILDTPMLGYEVHAFLRCNVEAHDPATAARRLSANEAVRTAYQLVGSRMLLVDILARTPQDLQQTIDRELIPIGLKDLEVDLVSMEHAGSFMRARAGRV
ncbi:MAG TPA: Lrp/AsnC family transcriptional regulator [Thermoplasmata archaeon]|nr:Lrp/AsnC family transcriptional regulator [Thermoplasmata archaeon]